MSDVTEVEFETRSLFPQAIQISKLPNVEELNKRLLVEVNKIKKATSSGRPKSWISSVYTSLHAMDNLHQQDVFSELCDQILLHAENYARTLAIDLNNYRLAYRDCWFNVYGWKDGQEIHQHPNSLISGSYYLKIPKGTPGIVFHSAAMDNMYLPPQTEPNNYNIDYYEVDVEPGALVLFRSNLKHSVRPNMVNKDRISISFNFWLQ